MTENKMRATKPKMKLMPRYAHNRELTLRIHTEESAFSTLKKKWEKLARLSNQMICMSPEWAAVWWKHYGSHKNRSLFIVTVYDNRRLIAIFPLYKGITKLGGITLQKRIQIIGSGGNSNEQLGFSDDYGISDFLDLIVDPDYEQRVADHILKCLTSSKFADHQIIFHQTRDDSFVVRTLYPLLTEARQGVRKEYSDVTYYIEVDGEGDLKGFIKNSKSNARRRFRQTLRARGAENDYIIEEPVGLAGVEQMIDRLIVMHQDRWNKIGFPGAFTDKRFRKFLKDISYAAYQDGRLWIKQAVDEDGVCAVRMLLMYNGRYYDYMSGYDDDSPSAKRRPGIGLLLNLIEDSFELPIERIELLRGDEGYKNDFTQLSMSNWKIIIPELKHWKTGWGLSSAAVHFSSIFYKYYNREITLMKVQHEKGGFFNMFSGYFKFRKETVIQKINERKRAD